MKRLLAVLILFYFITGCTSNDGTGPALDLREKMQRSAGCSFTASITADYGDVTYDFVMDCITEDFSNVTFTVIEPETIHGITGYMDEIGGNLTFDDQVLAFPLVADEQLSPISAPWLLIQTLYSGYISSGGKDGPNYKVQMDDSYEENPLHMDVWLDDKNIPIHCDFLWNNRRILTVEITNFVFL